MRIIRAFNSPDTHSAERIPFECESIRKKGVPSKCSRGRKSGWISTSPRVLKLMSMITTNLKSKKRLLRLTVIPLLILFFFSITIVFSFSGCGGVDVEEQIRLLESKDPVVRLSAAFKLGNSGSKKAVMPLVRALSDRDIRVRRRAAEALGKFEDGRAAKALVKCLRDKDVSLRVLSRQSLIKIGGPAVPHLILLLGSKDERLRKEAGEMLVSIGALSVRPLIALLEHKNPEIRVEAATLLGEIGYIEAHDPLKKALEDSDERVRAAAAAALDKISKALNRTSPEKSAP